MAHTLQFALQAPVRKPAQCQERHSKQCINIINMKGENDVSMPLTQQ